MSESNPIRTGRNVEQFHYTLERAANEFGCARETLTAAIKKQGIEPCFNDKTFSAYQIHKALSPQKGRKDAEQVRLISAQADIAEMKKSKMNRELVPTADVERVWSGVMLELRNKISYAAIPDAAKAELNRDLQSIPIDEYFKEANTATEEEDSAQQ